LSAIRSSSIGPLLRAMSFVALEPSQHLRRHLSADTACGETVRVEERGMSRVPLFGNRIPDEDDLRSYCERRIGSRIPSRIRPIPRLASG